MHTSLLYSRKTVCEKSIMSEFIKLEAKDDLQFGEILRFAYGTYYLMVVK